jgi:hypothetical protein
MHDIKILEEEWIQYKKNRRKPYYIFTLLSIVIVGLAFYFLKIDKTINIVNDEIVETKIDKIKLVVDKPLLDTSIDTLSLKIDNLDKPLNKELSHIKELIPTLPVVNDIPIIDTVLSKTNVLEKKSIERPKVKRNIFIEKPHKKMHLDITKSSSKSAYKEVEKRFNQFQDPDDSLFLAKSYYANKEYKKSEYWALRTNKLNKNNEESWIIFVKSKIKLGYKEDAIHILSNYVKQSDSQEAKMLLYKLKK